MFKPVLKEIHGKKYLYLIDRLKVNTKSIEVSLYAGRIENVTLSDFMSKTTEMEILRLKKYLDACAALYPPSMILSSDEMRDLEVARYYRAEFIEYYPDESAKYEQSVFVRYVQGTTAIEGNTISPSEASALIDYGVSPAGKKIEEVFEVINYINLRNYLKSYTGSLNEKLILKIHEILMERLMHTPPGEYRRVSVAISGMDYMPPVALLVPAEIQNLLDWYKHNKKKVHPFELAVIFHTRFEMIHPFPDGNGRVGRALMNFILEREGYPTLYFGSAERNAYVDALIFADSGNFEPIVHTLFKFYQGQHKQISDEVKSAMSNPKRRNNRIRTKLFKAAVSEFARLRVISGCEP